MENKQLARPFRQLAQLLELYEENSFKVKAVASAGLKIDKNPVLLWELPARELEKIEGIGKSITAKIIEIRLSGVLAELEELKNKTPSGILEMLRIKGLGPKKTRIIWKEMELETLADLYYACNENRLIEIKGFGSKTQEEIKKALEFTFRSQGKFLYSLAEPVSIDWLTQISKIDGVLEVQVSGAMRRKIEVVEEIEFVVKCSSTAPITAYFNGIEAIEWQEFSTTLFLPACQILAFKDFSGIPVRIYQTDENHFINTLFLTTGSTAHLAAIGLTLPFPKSEHTIYAALGLQYIEPEMREGLNEIELARKGFIRPLIHFTDLKGSIHNHSTHSDGVHTLLEMANACISLAFEYIVMTDHSQAAFYAHGLTPGQLIIQHAEIDKLNKALAPFHIFKGIESDILSDGRLDYEQDVLSTFDIIIASIHSNLRMDLNKSMIRLIKAIENPYTTMLGHATGRLLLGREGYPIDHKKIIDACALNEVVIEINANPNRLDLEWRYIPYALEQGVMLSINPDAHRTDGITDMRYGINMGRKGGLSKEMCLNTCTCAELSSWIAARKERKGIA